MAQKLAKAARGRTSRATLATYVLLLLCIAGQTACHRTPPRIAAATTTFAPPLDKPDVILSPTHQPFRFVAYGDIRFTSPGPITKSEVSSYYARDAIVHAIAKQEPAFVLISGDLVWRGANLSDWKRFDWETTPLRDAHIPIFPTVGNHEYYNSQFLGSGRDAGLSNYLARFPAIPKRPSMPWYSLQYANCYFLMLDSEDDDSPGSTQMNWVQRQLDSLPAGIDYLFVVLHRPPHTSARDGAHRARLSEMQLADLLEARQQKSQSPRIIVIAGHVHNYERYKRNRMMLVVSGGGGAHPYYLTRGDDDLYRPADPRETEYHYCLITVDHAKLQFQMYRLADGRPTTFEVRDSFELGPTGD